MHVGVEQPVDDEERPFHPPDLRFSISIRSGPAEARIDSIVYSLFDLTPDEIALLESVV